MPGNEVVINGTIRYYVGDSKMPQLMSILNEIAHFEGSDENATESDDNGEAEKM